MNRCLVPSLLACLALETAGADLAIERTKAYAERLNEGDMPPEKAPQPSESEREQLLGWITGAMEAAGASQTGDPGLVTLRRLTKGEYDHAVRDLTGVDMRPTRAGEFAPDIVGGGLCQCRRGDANDSRVYERRPSEGQTQSLRLEKARGWDGPRSQWPSGAR